MCIYLLVLEIGDWISDHKHNSVPEDLCSKIQDLQSVTPSEELVPSVLRAWTPVGTHMFLSSL